MLAWAQFLIIAYRCMFYLVVHRMKPCRCRISYAVLRPRPTPHVALPTMVPTVSQVLKLCRGLLQPDPSKRQTASEGHSLASWFVSRLETADEGDAKEPTAAVTGSDPAACDSHEKGPPIASCGAHYGKIRAASSAGGGDACAASARSSSKDLEIAPVDRHQHTRGRRTPPLPSGGARANQECRRDQVLVLPPGDAGGDKREEGGGAAVGLASSSEEERRLGEPDELVR